MLESSPSVNIDITVIYGYPISAGRFPSVCVNVIYNYTESSRQFSQCLYKYNEYLYFCEINQALILMHTPL